MKKRVLELDSELAKPKIDMNQRRVVRPNSYDGRQNYRNERNQNRRNYPRRNFRQNGYENSFPDVTCYTCGQLGHISRLCTVTHNTSWVWRPKKLQEKESQQVWVPKILT